MRASLSASIYLSLLIPAVPTLCNPLTSGTSNVDSIRHDDVQIQPLKLVNTAHPLAVRAPDDTSLCKSDEKICAFWCIPKDQHCGWNDRPHPWPRSIHSPESSDALAVRSPDIGCAEDNKRCGLLCIPKDEKCDPNYGCSDDNKRCGWMCIDKNEECNEETGGWDWWRRSLEDDSHALAVRSPDIGCAEDNKRCGILCIPKDEKCNPNYGCSDDNKRCGLMCIDKNEECNKETGGWDWWRRSLESTPHSLAVRSPDGLWCADDNKRCGWMCISKDEQCCGNQGSCSANEECHKNDNGEYGCCAKGDTCTNTNGTWLHGVREVGNDIKDGVKSVVGGGAADLRPGMAPVWMLTSVFVVALLL
ncbi:hypothetical protein ABOM_009637 [Aspergillus bombycis]|uniref:Uncharacterized protein n=1 Tax=Aspergillus bombycis TaxID=109264 RepID=A0A1F7ZQV3_9EURO|nr:hypothetical protein ABOM_009637 [Aspergillus bombycis]OGM41841.1 hypothetical protein ABOM_009637 [Aspergillus bombycis]